VIYGYGDLSGTPQSDVIVAACYVGHESKWVALDRLWRAALRDAKARYFHATDFFACRGEFAGWERGSLRHRRAEGAFARAPGAVGLIGLAFGAETSAFPALRAEFEKARAPHRIRTLRLLCVQGCLEGIARLNKEHPMDRDERVAVVMESEQGIGEVVDYFNFAKKRRAEWTRGLIGVTHAGKELARLQAADLLAYEARKRLQGFLVCPDAPPRPTFARLIATENVKVELLTEERSRAAVPQIREFLKEWPDGLAKSPADAARAGKRSGGRTR
jgi:hypothetical protein